MFMSGFPRSWSTLKKLMWLKLNAAASYILKTLTGAVVSFSDAIRGSKLVSLTATISPVQDLHGFDHPWPGGGGKNLLDISHLIGKTTIKGVEFEARADGSIVVNGTPSSGNAEFPLFPTETPLYLPAGEYKFSGTTGGSSSTYRMYITGGGSSAHANNNGDTSITVSDPTVRVQIGITVFNGFSADNVVFWPMLRRAAETDPTYEPYENICLIGGWTGVTAVRDGENILPNDIVQGTLSKGQPLNSSQAVRSGDFFFLKAGSYVLNGETQSDVELFGTVAFYDLSEKTFLGYVDGGFTSLPLAVNAESDCYAKAVFRRAGGLTPPDLTVASIAVGNTPTSAAYQGDTYPVTWETEAGTVHGGEIELVSGELQSAWALLDIDSTTIAITGSVPRFRLSQVTTSWQDAMPICSKLKSVDYPSMVAGTEDNCITSDINGAYIYCRVSSLSTVEEFRAFMSGQQILYKLRSPQTYQLPGTPIPTRKGTNNVWADTGDVTVTYKAKA